MKGRIGLEDPIMVATHSAAGPNVTKSGLGAVGHVFDRAQLHSRFSRHERGGTAVPSGTVTWLFVETRSFNGAEL